MRQQLAEAIKYFEPLVPNKETIEAMKAARRGKLTTVKNIDNLLKAKDHEDH